MRLPAVVRLLRPHQWTKNLFVFAPVLFAHDFDKTDRNLRAAAAFGIFCLLASGIYVLNDVLDREADRQHPRKRLRPVASGEVSVPAAVALAVALLAGGLAWARLGLDSRNVTAVCVTYVVLQGAYSAWLKRIVVLDVLCISSGFVLRMFAGATAVWIQQSAWILLCTIFLSLFLALCKRRHEVVSLGDGAAAHRAILADYPPALLDQFISIAAGATLLAYALYTVDQRTIDAHGLPGPVLAVTLPFVIFGLFRYLLLVYARDRGGSPTSTLLRDVPSLVNGVLYLGTVLAIFVTFRNAPGG